jgi:hypothetical protein
VRSAHAGCRRPPRVPLAWMSAQPLVHTRPHRVGHRGRSLYPGGGQRALSPVRSSQSDIVIVGQAWACPGMRGPAASANMSAEPRAHKGDTLARQLCPRNSSLGSFLETFSDLVR